MDKQKCKECGQPLETETKADGSLTWERTSCQNMKCDKLYEPVQEEQGK